MTAEGRDALGLAGLTNADCLVIADESGRTGIAHNLSDGSLQSTIINTASAAICAKRSASRCTLPGLEAVQDLITAERFRLRIGDEMRP